MTTAHPPGGEAKPQNSANSLLNIDELAIVLRCSKAHACKLLKGQVAGLPPLPHLSLGRRKLIRQAALDQWMIRVEVGETDAAVLSSVRQDSTLSAHGKEN